MTQDLLSLLNVTVAIGWQSEVKRVRVGEKTAPTRNALADSVAQARVMEGIHNLLGRQN